MRSKMHGLLAAGTVCVLASTSALALDPAPKCESSKLGTSAKYASCRLKADSKSVKTGDPVNYSKCNLDKFASAETTAGLGVCPTESDQATVKSYLDDCTSRAAMWLAGGGGLPDTCESDLSTTNADLSSCESDLSTTNADLTTCEGDLAACEASSGGLPVTGQTTSYGTGTDGAVQAGVVRSFTDNGDGTITDNVTGLMWEKKDDSGFDAIHDKDTFYTWSIGTNLMDGTIATIFLATLNSGGGFAGHTDWRVPNLFELFSLVNLQSENPSTYSVFDTGCVAACTVTTCSCTESNDYWSSSTDQSSPLETRGVSFFAGITSYDVKTESRPVRAVRGGV